MRYLLVVIMTAFWQLVLLATVTAQGPYESIFNLLDPNISILKESRLYLEGSSNVNKFSCECEQDFSDFQVVFQLDTQGRSVSFDETFLTIKTSMLDCGNKGMNKDLQATLQEKVYPHITIQLEKVELNISKSAIGPIWTHLIAHTRLNLVGKTQTIKMPIMARRLSKDVFQFKSFYQLTLTSFGIEPPTALLGIVKVRDEITIHFDLHIQANSL